MSHLFRFIGGRDAGGTWTVTGDELHHLAKVLRLNPGDDIEITDGQGAVATGKVDQMTSKVATLALTGEVQIPPPRFAVRLLLGALKPGSFDDLLPDLIELGVDHLDIFIHQGDAKTRTAESAVARWQRIMTQAVKQSKRAYLPTMTIHQTLYQALTAAPVIPSPPTQNSAPVIPSPPKAGVGDPSALKFVLTPGTDVQLNTVDLNNVTSVTIACGGEKGFNDEELRDLKRAAFKPVALTSTILRATTAAVAATTLMCVARDGK